MKLLRIVLKESKRLIECGYSYWGSVHTAVTLLVAKENGAKIPAHTEAALRVLAQWTMYNKGFQF